ncbi:uncharacterized protein LOC121861101 [Homarus americanus]|uniref:uncharacterized protein LOC121861101 n=1 Tax=Homarus americanus TaxID=6706 RepID=UPI001C48D031|nr:uncharacterized protein LOC121861101 [Homarus americanus]
MGELHFTEWETCTPLQPVRIDSSHFYLQQKCLGASGGHLEPEVHDFIFRYMMTEELHGRQEIRHCIDYDTRMTSFIKMARFSPITNESYWAQGQPDKQSKLMIVAVNTRQTSILIHWYLLPAEDCSDRNVSLSLNYPSVIGNLDVNRSADCVQAIVQSFPQIQLDIKQVSFWQVELTEDAKILDTMLVSVADVIIHPGVFENQCAENKESVCCFSPTYDYYIQNKFGGPGSHSIHGATRSQCWMKLKGSYKYPLVQCDKALHRVGDLHPLPQPVRIDSSYFYFSNKKCLGERRAVISSREVHDFIFRYMMTEELHVEDRKFVIGIDYDIEDDQFHWENGKILTYYNESYWAQGQPDKQSKLDDRSCVAYMKTNINSYSWYLLPAEDCSDRNVLTVCELPIRSTNVVPTERKLECGQRVERGVLARSGYSSTEYYEEAQYGEFPWHVAVVQPNNYREGVVMVFVCSGALIHHQFVLTSAHCVSYTGNRDLAVSFGEWNLAEDAKQILDTMLVSVADVIIHPGFASIDSVVHDVALLHLDQVVEANSYPHVGLGCLPSPHLFYQKTGAWECFTVGWPEHSRHGSSYSFTDSSKRGRRVLQRIESDFVPRIRCRSLTRSYYRALRSQKPQQYGYDKEYGYHHATYEHHSYFDLREPELICTEPYESDTCLDDSTPILVCRKAQFYTDDPFHTGQHGYPYGNTRSNKYESSNSRIINAYGKERFDSEKWYVMGVGHSLNKCSDESYHKRHKSHQVFTPVHEYLSFIHAHLDIQYSEPNPY